jgi:hypothetical protein
MQKQNTIFMTLEPQQQQQQQQLLSNNLKNKYCGECNKPLTKIQKCYCSRKCQKEFHKIQCLVCNKRVKRRKLNGVQTKKYCSRECQKEFYKIQCLVCHRKVKGRLLHGVQTRKYCSRDCSSYDAKGKPIPNKYSKKGYCRVCLKWISKEDAILKPKGTEFLIAWNICKLKKDNYYCNICKTRLVVKKGKSKKEIKRID